MAHLLDFVPNHMGIEGPENAWWWDVLENGPSSPYAHFFDIEWTPVKPELLNKVLLPLLEDTYGAVLERGDLQLAVASGTVVLKYHTNIFPINPRQLPRILNLNLDLLRAELKDDPSLREFLSILTGFGALTTDFQPDAGKDRRTPA